MKIHEAPRKSMKIHAHVPPPMDKGTFLACSHQGPPMASFTWVDPLQQGTPDMVHAMGGELGRSMGVQPPWKVPPVPKTISSSTVLRT